MNPWGQLLGEVVELSPPQFARVHSHSSTYTKDNGPTTRAGRRAAAEAAARRRAATPWDLTPMEAKTLEYMSQFGSVKATAEALDRSPNSIDVHLTNVRKKMGVNTTLMAVLMWDRHNRKAA